MHQYLVTLAVQVRPGVDEPPIVIKVQMSDNLYARKTDAQRRQIIENFAMETLVAVEGWLYLAVILDLFSRKVVGWKLL